jgi:hypothetical protein
MDDVDVILKTVKNQHSNSETDGGAHRLVGLHVGSTGPTWQGLGLRIGEEAPRVF